MNINGKKTTKEEKKLIEAHNKHMKLKTFENNLAEMTCRARSVVIGTAFGGCSEVSMRRPDGTVTFAILQPVEMVELINQMAANIGCHLLLQPREDFATWREWKHNPQELAHFRGVQHLPGVGHPPHTKTIEEDYSAKLPSPNEQPGMAAPVKPVIVKEQIIPEKPAKQRKNKKDPISESTSAE